VKLQPLRDINFHDLFIMFCCKLVIELVSIVETFEADICCLLRSLLVLLSLSIKLRGVVEYFASLLRES
jgi:hypothetical protein